MEALAESGLLRTETSHAVTGDYRISKCSPFRKPLQESTFHGEGEAGTSCTCAVAGGGINGKAPKSGKGLSCVIVRTLKDHLHLHGFLINTLQYLTNCAISCTNSLTREFMFLPTTYAYLVGEETVGWVKNVSQVREVGGRQTAVSSD